MALFSRKDRKADIDKYITEAIEKAAQSLMGTPMYNQAGYANVIPAQPVGGQGLAQQSGWEAVALPRPGDAFGSMLGPAAPLLPSPIDPVNPDTGRAEPRKFQFQVAYNLNLTQQDVPWSVLRALADQCDIIARAITIRVSEVVKMNWSFTLSDLAITEIMAEQNVSHAQAAKIGRDKYKNQISDLTEFWENPYPQADRGWSEWITEFSWQHLVYDGVPVFPQYNLGGKIIGFNIIDAPTIKILLDNRGDIPRPPAPAFQQILWGFPRGEFTASPDSNVDGEYYANAEGTSFKTDTMAYFIRNRRTWSPYGFSAVEQAIPAATLYLERQRWFIDDFQAGTMPMTFMKTDSQEIDHLRLAAFERVFNDKMVGSSEERHKIKVLPKGFDPVIAPEMTERYKPEMDEYIIKKIASIFGIAPGQLGVVARAGLGGGKGAHDGEEQSAETVSARPMENFIVEVVNNLCRRFLGMDKNVTFNLEDRSTAENEAEKAKAYQVALSSGTMTLNDARGDMGLPLYDMKEADEPFLLTANGPVFLKGTLDTQQQQAQAQAQGATNDQAKPGKDTQAPQGEESSQGTPPTNNGKGKNQKTGVDEQKSAEAKAYKVFSRTPRGREFEFVFHTPEEIAILKAQVAEPKAQIKDTPKERSATKGYNPDQERDSSGRFGSGGGSSSQSENAPFQHLMDGKQIDPVKVKTMNDLQSVAQMEKLPSDNEKYQYFYHSLGDSSTMSPILAEGLKGGSSQFQSEKVYLSKDEIRSKGAGYVIVRVPTGQAKEGTDYVMPGVTYREFTVGSVPPEDIVRGIREVNLNGSSGRFTEPQLANALTSYQQGSPNAVAENSGGKLPSAYAGWENVSDNPYKSKAANPDLAKRRTQDVPGWHERDAVIKKFRVFIQAGLNNLVTGVKPTIEQAIKATATDPATVKSVSYLAVAQNIKMDTTKLDAALKALHEAAIAAGIDVAAKQVNIAPIQGGRAITDLLNQRSITLKQLTQTTLDRINTAVANGVANGHDYKTISQSIYAAINGQSPETIPTAPMAPGSYGTDVAVQTRADIIAMTETNRAYNAGTIDTYVEAGASGWNWITDGNPCELCLAKEAENPHALDDDVPPEHPYCQCGMEAVWDNAQSGDAVSQDVTQSAE